jgi:hypothetical protein
MIVPALNQAYSCEGQDRYDLRYTGDGEADKQMLRSKPQTASNFFEYRKIADAARSRLATVFAPSELNRRLFEDHIEKAVILFLEHFEEVKDAIAGMVYPYEKKGIVDDYLSISIGSNLTDEFTDELAKYEPYKTLFGIVSEGSADDAENLILPAYGSNSSCEEYSW